MICHNICEGPDVTSKGPATYPYAISFDARVSRTAEPHVYCVPLSHNIFYNETLGTETSLVVRLYHKSMGVFHLHTPCYLVLSVIGPGCLHVCRPES